MLAYCVLLVVNAKNHLLASPPAYTVNILLNITFNLEIELFVYYIIQKENITCNKNVTASKTYS